MPDLPLDYRTAFDLAPIGLVLSRQRQIVDCNQLLLAMFGAQRDQLLGRSFELLYPSAVEFERTGDRIIASLDGQGRYGDERVMIRMATIWRCAYRGSPGSPGGAAPGASAGHGRHPPCAG